MAKAHRSKKIETETETRHTVSVREFLNTHGHHSIASICGTIDVREYVRKEDDYNADSLYCSLTINDCNKQVVLSIDADTEENYNNTIYKLTTLIETLEVFRDEVKKEFTRVVLPAIASKKKRRRGRNGVEVLDTAPDGAIGPL